MLHNYKCEKKCLRKWNIFLKYFFKCNYNRSIERHIYNRAVGKFCVSFAFLCSISHLPKFNARFILYINRLLFLHLFLFILFICLLRVLELLRYSCYLFFVLFYFFLLFASLWSSAKCVLTKHHKRTHTHTKAIVCAYVCVRMLMCITKRRSCCPEFVIFFLFCVFFCYCLFYSLLCCVLHAAVNVKQLTELATYLS